MFKSANVVLKGGLQAEDNGSGGLTQQWGLGLSNCLTRGPSKAACLPLLSPETCLQARLREGLSLPSNSPALEVPKDGPLPFSELSCYPGSMSSK